MVLEIFVQGKDELDVEKVKKFIESCVDAKLVLIHSSLRDEHIFSDYVDELIAKLKIPFIDGMIILE